MGDIVKSDINYIDRLAGHNDYLTEVVTKFLELEYQLSKPGEQSFYFKVVIAMG